MTDPIAPKGIPLMNMYSTSMIQDETYNKGLLSPGIITTDPELMELLMGADPSDLSKSEGEFSQHFERIDFGGVGEQKISRQGLFEFRLILATPPRIADYVLEINVRWEMEGENGVSSQDLVEAYDIARAAIFDVWGGYYLWGKKTNSEIIRIDICPQILRNTDGNYIKVSVYPDTAFTFDVKGQQIDLGYFSSEWRMFKTFSFSKMRRELNAKDDDGKFTCHHRYMTTLTNGIDDQGRMTKIEPFRKGKGLHEFGHMIGLPHDLDLDSIMYTSELDGKRPATDCWRYHDIDVDGSRPFTSHFRMAKLWVEKILREELRIKTNLIISY